MPCSMKVYPQAMDNVEEMPYDGEHRLFAAARRMFVAVVNPGFDWAAYQRMDKMDSRFEDSAVRCAEFGDKLPREIARFFFRGIDLPYRD